MEVVLRPWKQKKISQTYLQPKDRRVYTASGRWVVYTEEYDWREVWRTKL